MKSLIIMESPAKAKKVASMLGSEYIVKASVGHIREIPTPKNMSDKQKKKYGDYGVDVKSADFDTLYKISPLKTKVVKDLKDSLTRADQLIIFTDADNEGHAIGYHLLEVLQPHVPTYRAVTNEITKDAVLKALQDMVKIDVKNKTPHWFFQQAQSALARAVWDRLYGYSTSPYLWRITGAGSSSGRVQTPGTKLVVEREYKRLNFTSIKYYTITGVFHGVKATLVEYNGIKIAGRKNIGEDGVVPPEYLLITDDNVDTIIENLRGKDYTVDNVSSKPYKRTPPPPFTTSTGLQSIGAKTGMGSKQITSFFQDLYGSDGAITYIRTVSVTSSIEAVKAARDLLRKLYGDDMVPPTPRIYVDKKSANSGHECIRPVTHNDALKYEKFKDAKKQQVYDIVFKRYLASQSIDCTGVTWTVLFKSKDKKAVFHASEVEVSEQGWMRIYDDGEDG